MKAPSAKLSVWVEKCSAFIRIVGRANCNASVEFKSLVNALYDRGHHHFVLDLKECLIMDSTFLGVLAGLGQRFNEATTDSHTPSIELHNPSERVADLLDNLGVSDLFLFAEGTADDHAREDETEVIPATPTKRAVTEASLDAHQTLMRLSPANIPKFKDVTRFLEEDIKHMDEAAAKASDKS